jgi:hypothetical protein
LALESEGDRPMRASADSRLSAHEPAISGEDL